MSPLYRVCFKDPTQRGIAVRANDYHDAVEKAWEHAQKKLRIDWVSRIESVDVITEANQ